MFSDDLESIISNQTKTQKTIYKKTQEQLATIPCLSNQQKRGIPTTKIKLKKERSKRIKKAKENIFKNLTRKKRGNVFNKEAEMA